MTKIASKPMSVQEFLNLKTENRVKGVPDLVVEILLPRSTRFDRGGKMKLYRNHKVQEYWGRSQKPIDRNICE